MFPGAINQQTNIIYNEGDLSGIEYVICHWIFTAIAILDTDWFPSQSGTFWVLRGRSHSTQCLWSRQARHRLFQNHPRRGGFVCAKSIFDGSGQGLPYCTLHRANQIRQEVGHMDVIATLNLKHTQKRATMSLCRLLTHSRNTKIKKRN